MKIRNRLTILFTAIITAILLFFAVTVYLAYADFRDDQYVKRIEQQAYTKVRLLLQGQISPSVLKVIYENQPNTLFQEEMAVYDDQFKLIYHDDISEDFVKETSAMLQQICRTGNVQFKQEDRQVVGFLYQHGERTYLVTAAAYDEYGLSKLANLRNTIILTFIISILVVVVAGRFFASQALAPMADVVRQVGQITATSLHNRVPEGNGRDEIAELAITFNQMLDRLEKSFEAQQHFVSNVAHETGTPLAGIIAELDLAQRRTRQTEDYQQIIQRVLADARRLGRLTDGLLNLAKASYDPSVITMKPLRIDEILLDASHQVIRKDSACRVDMAFDPLADTDEPIIVRGNEYLLRVAFANIMENSCKFSADHHCLVTIRQEDQGCAIYFRDEGVGIQPDDLPHLFTPFYRGSQARQAEGHGIGLSLTYRIVTLHHGRINVQSVPGAGTTFCIHLPLE
nr:ATP-binding protein [uncultured Arsenicibacter sp.]